MIRASWLMFIFFSQSAFAVPAQIEGLFQRMEQENLSLQGAKLDVQFQEQSLRGARSKLYPTLSLSLVASEGEDSALSTTASASASSASPAAGGLGAQSGGLTDVNANSGWMTQFSTNYLLFTKFAVSDSIDRARSNIEISQIDETSVRDEKRSQMLQLLLEWQVLSKVVGPIDQAEKMIQKVLKFSKGRSRMLYTRQDRLKLKENSTSLQYNKIKVHEGLRLVESALMTLVPSLSTKELSKLPVIQVDFPVPQQEELRKHYRQQSRNHKKNLLKINTSKSYLDSTGWDRPWVPNIYWSASWSKTGNYSGVENNSGASTSLLFSFNLFDGFYTQARHQQAAIGVKAEVLKAKAEEDRRVLLLKHQRMKALVAKAEYSYRSAVAEKKYLRYQDIRRKMKSGIGTKLEMSLSTLDWVKAQMKALESLKDYQQALLGMAVELNQWKEVKIDEVAS